MMLNDFYPGQRWISDSELQLGLGTVLNVDFRSVTIVFLATGDTRTYAKETAPLTRVHFTAQDRIQSHEGWTLTVESVQEHEGLLTYSGFREDGAPATLEEGQLDNFIRLNRPSDRLFTGQIDNDKWYELRHATLNHSYQLGQSEIRGLSGGRISLIPHQLYIAHEVARRYAPRVLLADEVGLGKTIEAGMIIHQQLITERARRVLIVVPDTLVHQWLVEMLRRFNLHFSIFNEERCEAIEESAGQSNPFQSEQLVLCSLDFLCHQNTRYEQALEAEWDLMVVDEAHHLEWSPQHSSHEYQVVESLSQRTKGVLLLTATPEQLGKEGHFARLRLLDPDRFHDYSKFQQEEQEYEPIANAVEALLGNENLAGQVLKTVATTLPEGDNEGLLEVLLKPELDEDSRHQARTELLDHLLDRHGTGRVLFRNTRAAVKGFPERALFAYALPLPPAYAECLTLFQGSGVSDPQLLLSPELLYQSSPEEKNNPWSDIDPRVSWLGDRLKSLRPHKVLVITASADTALDLAQTLRTRTGLHAAVFHEGMSIVERDRAAAYFADPEYGTQVLLCSEIGSEGRNFQFAHHLILFDLPLNPDLLEQRIGRLDRIGQTETINIHVPYLENSPQSLMFNWYHDGLNAFTQTCPAGHGVFTEVHDTLLDALHQTDEGLADLETLIDATRAIHARLNKALDRGRDRLLEFNSCRMHIARELVKHASNQDHNNELQNYLENVFDCYGLEFEEDTDQVYFVRPGNHMTVSSFPGVDQDGISVTFDRATALANEDLHFLTWEHPLVEGAIDMVLTSEAGNTAVTAIKSTDLPAGSMLLECLYVLQPATGRELQAGCYLPAVTIRTLLDQDGNDRSAILSMDTIQSSRIRIKNDIAAKIVKSQGDEIRKLLTASEKAAFNKLADTCASAYRQTLHLLESELNRLKALRKLNTNIREEEIEYFSIQLDNLNTLLSSIHPRLDAVRVIISA